MNRWKLLGIVFTLIGAAIGVLSALDNYWETDAELMTPPTTYVSPWYVPPYADFLWVGFGALAMACMARGRAPSGPVSSQE